MQVDQESDATTPIRSTTAVLNPLPSIVLPLGKRMPHFVYSSKTYGDGSAQSSDSIMIRQRSREIKSDGSFRKLDQRDGKDLEDLEDLEDLHEYYPSGQHLLVDIKNVDGSFLNSESRLAKATIDLAESSSLTLLSFHCHQLVPVGVSCIGVLLESHVSFHTWPVSGVISLDLFTCGPHSLVSLLPVVKDLFAIPRRPGETAGGIVEQPHVEWAHKLRGFKKLDNRDDPEDVDLNHYLLGWMGYGLKNTILSEETDYQKVEIYEVIDPHFQRHESYIRSLVKGDSSYESQHPELFRPDRVFYLDGVMQSRLFGEAAYHEALVHPAMFAHDNPRRVAIMGGGDGGTLREVLKHESVEKVVMIEIDEDLVGFAREYLPEWSDCSNLVGSVESCFDDARAEVMYGDAVEWFKERYWLKNGAEDVSFEEYDVIIIDAL
jgi:S-adenosylmethionine decarboxylase proenzyme